MVKKRQFQSKNVSINSIRDLIDLARKDDIPPSINKKILQNILPQLCEIDELIGMYELKDTLLHQILFYLTDLAVSDEFNYLHTVISGPPGCGKCLGENTPVLLYDGTIKMSQDIEIGDELMGDDSTKRVVLSIVNGHGRLYKIKQNYGLNYIVNSSHILTLSNGIDMIDIDIEEYLKDNDINSTFFGVKKPIDFKMKTPFPLDAYVFGYLVFSFNFNNNKYNKNVIEIPNDHVYAYFDQVNAIERELFANFYVIKPEYTMFLENVQFDQDFIKLVWLSGLQTCKELLEGILDSRAEIIKDDKYQLHFLNDNLDMFKFVKAMCDCLAIHYTCLENNYSIHFVESSCSSFVKTLRIHDYKQLLNSKKRQINHNNLELNHMVLSSLQIEDVGYGMYYGFELSGNGRFLLEDGTITHNTTVAKLIGEMYKNMGILSKNGVFKVAKRDDFVAEYLGQTAIKTKKLLESCIGGVLFIDEAYALGPGKKDKDSFSKEAIDTLNVFLSEHADEFCCIIAGYEDEINHCFFSVNPGLERRFHWIHRITEYNSNNLSEMFFQQLHESRWKTNVDLDFIANLIEQNKQLFSQFGGDIENFSTKCKMAHARNIINEPERKNILNEQDILDGLEFLKKHKVTSETKEDNLSKLSMYI